MFGIIFEQILLLFIFMLCGFLLGKSKVLNSEQSKILSVLEIYMFLPCTVFNAFYTNFTVVNIKNYSKLMLSAVVILIALVLLAKFISKLLTKDAYGRKVYEYSLTISNYGYMGYAIAQGLFGAEGLLCMVLFALPFSLYTYTFGYAMLTKKEISFKRILNPVIIAILIGIVFGLSQIKLPAVAETFISKSGACMAPISMLLTGITISQFNLKSLICGKGVYIVSILRLLVIPFAVMLLTKSIMGETVARYAVLLTAMPCGLNTIVFPKLIDESGKMGAKLAFVSNILALVTIPIVLSFI